MDDDILDPSTIPRLLRALLPTSLGDNAASGAGKPDNVACASQQRESAGLSAEGAGALLWDLSASRHSATALAQNQGLQILHHVIVYNVRALQDPEAADVDTPGDGLCGSACRLLELCLGTMANMALLPEVAEQLVAAHRDIGAILVKKVLFSTDPPSLSECCRLLSHALMSGGAAAGFTPTQDPAAAAVPDSTQQQQHYSYEQATSRLAPPSSAAPQSQLREPPQEQPHSFPNQFELAGSQGPVPPAPAETPTLVDLLTQRRVLQQLLWIAQNTLCPALHEHVMGLLVTLLQLPQAGMHCAVMLQQLGIDAILHSQLECVVRQLAARTLKLSSWDEAPDADGLSWAAEGAAVELAADSDPVNEAFKEADLQFQATNIAALLRILFELSECADAARSSCGVEVQAACTWESTPRLLRGLAALLKYVEGSTLGELLVMLLSRHAPTFVAELCSTEDAAPIEKLVHLLRESLPDDDDKMDACWYLLSVLTQKLVQSCQDNGRSPPAAAPAAPGDGVPVHTFHNTVLRFLAAELSKCPVPSSAQHYANACLACVAGWAAPSAAA